METCDTPGYGFINPNYIENLTKELAEAKGQNVLHEDFYAFMAREFAKYMDADSVYATPPMNWDILLAKIVVSRDKRIEELEGLLNRCRISINGLIGHNLDDPESWRHVGDEVISDAMRTLQEVRAAL